MWKYNHSSERRWWIEVRTEDVVYFTFAQTTRILNKGACNLCLSNSCAA